MKKYATPMHTIDVREHGVVPGSWLAFCRTCEWKTTTPTSLPELRWDVWAHASNRKVHVWPSKKGSRIKVRTSS